MNLVRNLLALKFGAVDEQLEKGINPILDFPAIGLCYNVGNLN